MSMSFAVGLFVGGGCVSGKLLRLLTLTNSDVFLHASATQNTKHKMSDTIPHQQDNHAGDITDTACEHAEVAKMKLLSPPDQLVKTLSDERPFVSYEDVVQVPNCVTFHQNLEHDLRIAFSAKDREDSESYSSGSTFFISKNMKPRCFLEALALDIFDAHVRPIDSSKGIFYDAEVSGVEWWTLLMDEDEDQDVQGDEDSGSDHSSENNDEDDEDMCDVGLHYDADFGLEAQSGGQIVLHPHVATVTYFSNFGVPTCIFNVKGSEILQMNPRTGGSIAIDTMYASAPAIGKHVAFNGELVHGAPSEVFPSPLKYDTTLDHSSFCYTKQTDPNVATTKRQKVEQVSKRRLRMTFLANVWLNHRPLDAEELDNDLLKQMRLSAQDIVHNGSKSQPEDDMNIATWNGISAGVEEKKSYIRDVLVDTRSSIKTSSKSVDAEIGGRTCSIVFQRLPQPSSMSKPGESLNIAWANTCLLNVSEFQEDEEE